MRILHPWARPTVLSALMLAAGLSAPARAIVIDTGAGHGAGGGATLYDDRPVTSGYQRIAARFTLSSPDLIGSVQGWVNWDGGLLNFSVFNDFQGLPGARLLTATAALAATATNQPDWRGVGSLGWSLAAGDYWLVFEDSQQAGSGSMPGGAPSPMAGYAIGGPALPGNVDWVRADTQGFGVRVNFGPEPPPPVVAEPPALLLCAAGAVWLSLTLGLRRRRGSDRPQPA